MSGRERPLGDRELDALLGQWLSGGADGPADRVAERAILAIATTPQEGTRLAAVASSFTRAPLAWAAAVGAAVVIGLGLLVGPGLLGDDATPSPVPSEDASASPSPSTPLAELILFTNSVDDIHYQLGVRPEWEQRELTQSGDPCVGVTAFGYAQPHDYPLLTISIGDADGSVRIPQTGGCSEVTASNLEELDAAVVSAPEGDAWAEETTEITLDGEPARYVRVQSPIGSQIDPAFHQVLAFHAGRPVVIAFDHYTVRDIPDALPMAQIIASFKWRDGPGKPDSAMTTHKLSNGIRFDTPEVWTATSHDRGMTLVGGRTTFSISVGSDGGEIPTCLSSAWPWEVCRGVMVSTLEELIDAVAADERGVPLAGLVESLPMTLDGEPAHRINVAGYEEPAHGAEHVTYVVAIHDGQPVILRLHTTAETPPLVWEEILASFRWTYHLVSNPEAGYELLVLTDSVPLVTVGEADGKIRLCGTVGCADEVVRTLEELERAVTSAPRQASMPGVTITTGHADTTLGGEPARTEFVRMIPNYLAGPRTYYHVYAMHNGRPFVLSFDHWAIKQGKVSLDNVAEIVASFRFLD